MRRSVPLLSTMLLAGFLTAPRLPAFATAPRLPAFATAIDPSGPGCAPCSDFNGDGFSDLAIGVPRENLGGVKDPGLVQVIPGSVSGLDGESALLLHQDLPGVPGTGEPADLLGFSLASGDFNGDGFADLAFGSPYEDTDATDLANAGAVWIAFGSEAGLDPSSSQMLDEDTSGVPGPAVSGDQFAFALTAADLDGDGYADLVVGVPHTDAGVARNAGSVIVLRGSPDGITTIGAREWTQDTPRFADQAESEDGFGSALAARDLNDDGVDDLAIGVPGEDVSTAADAGEVLEVLGSASGLDSVTTRRWTQSSKGVLEKPESGDGFGFNLTTGDVNGDGMGDLAVAAPMEDLAGAPDAGVVQVLLGSVDGLSATGNELWSQGEPGVRGTPAAGDRLGTGLAVGDLNGDGFDDLAAGARYDDEAGPADAGAVNVLFGSALGATAGRDQLWTQDATGVDASEVLDHFGSVLAAGRFGSEGADDLVIGVHFETVASPSGNLTHAGAMTVLRGSGSGPTATDAWFAVQDDLSETTESYDYFPFALRAGG